jgi:hypothetical protein
MLPGCAMPAAASLEREPADSFVSSAPTASLMPTEAPFTTMPTAEPDAKPAPASSQISESDSDEDDREVIADGFYYFPLTDEIKMRITGMSFPSDVKNCEITYDDLKYISLQYYDFDGNVHNDGELIVNEKLAKEVAQIFYELYKAKYPFTSIRLVDDYGEPGNDNLSMAANNTSAFNYRYVTGTESLSLHSYGYAIDINSRLNPYINGNSVSPENGAEYVDRSLRLAGMIDHDDLCYQLFTDRGWKWGGDWEGDKDYQHFYKKTVQ